MNVFEDMDILMEWHPGPRDGEWTPYVAVTLLGPDRPPTSIWLSLSAAHRLMDGLNFVTKNPAARRVEMRK